MRRFRQEYAGEFVQRERGEMSPEEIAMSRTRPFPQDRMVCRPVPGSESCEKMAEMMRMPERPSETSVVRW